MHMPAEWEPHEATWIAWPHNQDDWPDKFAAIPWVYAEIVRHLHASEEVCILVKSVVGERRARAVLDMMRLDWDRLWVTVHAGDPVMKLGPDEVAIELWRKVGMPNERIVR